MSFKSTSNNGVVYILLGAALFLRLWGISYGAYHADEPIVINHALAYGTGDLNPHFFKIPPLISYLLFGVYGVWFVAGKLIGFFPNLTSFQELYVRQPLVFYLIARLFFGVLPGVLTVWTVMNVAQKRWGRAAGIFAGLFIALNFLHARDSHFIYVDIPMTLMVFLAASTAYEVWDKGKKTDYLRSAVFAGLATAFKYNAVLSFLPLCVGHLLRKKRDHRIMLAVTASFIAVILALNPFALLDFRSFHAELLSQSRAQGFTGIGHHLFYSLAGAFGWPALALSAIGFFLMVKRCREEGIIFAVFPVIFYVSIVLVGQKHERYTLPLVPFISILAGITCAEVWRRTQIKRSTRWASILLLIVAFVWPLVKLVYANHLFTRPDTRDMAREWVEANIPTDSTLAFSHSFYRPYLNRSESQWKSLEPMPGQKSAPALKETLLRRFIGNDPKGYRLYYMSEEPSRHSFSSIRPLVAYDVQALKAIGVDYVILHYGGSSEHVDFYDEIKKTGRMKVRFSPYKDPSRSFNRDPYALTVGAFTATDLLSRACFGPTLEIYRISEVKS